MNTTYIPTDPLITYMRDRATVFPAGYTSADLHALIDAALTLADAAQTELEDRRFDYRLDRCSSPAWGSSQAVSR